MTEFLGQLFKSKSNARLARMYVDVVAGLCIGANYLVVMFQGVLTKSLEQFEVVILEEGMGNNGKSFVFCEGDHLQERVQ